MRALLGCVFFNNAGIISFFLFENLLIRMQNFIKQKLVVTAQCNFQSRKCLLVQQEERVISVANVKCFLSKVPSPTSQNTVLWEMSLFVQSTLELLEHSLSMSSALAAYR